MVKRSNHYEVAFEAYLRDHGIAYVAVNEARRTVVAQAGGLKHGEAGGVQHGEAGGVQHGAVTAKTAQAAAGQELTTLKSLDFIVSPSSGASRLLVDVKGRRFPSGVANPQYWRNWTTNDEIRSLAHWEELFGAGFTATLVFAFHVTGDRSPLPENDLYQHAGELYGFVAVRLADYISFARPLSSRWDTVTMPRAMFRSYGCSFSSLVS